jgi:gliding motility-associated lipoprotein GldH
MIRKIIPLLLTVLFFSSCQRKSYYHQSKTVSDLGWSINQVLGFNDSLSSDVPEVVHFEINLRHTNLYPYQNIWLYVHTKSSDGTTRMDSINLKLIEPNGRWLGSGWGSLYDISYRLPDLTIKKTNPKRWFKIDIQHGLRDNQLPGVEDIGIRLY